jgi:hypothetical protein
MIIIKDKVGQLCNRMWAYAPFISHSIETKQKIVILYFFKYAHLFEGFGSFKSVKVIKRKFSFSFAFYKLLSKFLGSFPEKVLNALNVYSSIDSFGYSAKGKLAIIKSWHHNKPPYPLRLNDIRLFFAPTSECLSKLNVLFMKWNKSFDLVIGVHIRKGDYKHYRNGIYYYNDNDYKRFMVEIKKHFPDKRLGFLLCSNEKHNIQDFQGLETMVVPEANATDDLFALSRCDFIIGPPSTFSMWASFYGQKPLRFVKSKDETIKMEEFSTIVSQNTFQNGNVFKHE